MENHGSSSEMKERLYQQVLTFWLSSGVLKLSSIKLIKEEGASYLFTRNQIYLHNHLFFQSHISICLFCITFFSGFDLVPCKYIVLDHFIISAHIYKQVLEIQKLKMENELKMNCNINVKKSVSYLK